MDESWFILVAILLLRELDREDADYGGHMWEADASVGACASAAL